MLDNSVNPPSTNLNNSS